MRTNFLMIKLFAVFLLFSNIAFSKETYTGKHLNVIRNYFQDVHRHVGLVSNILPDGSRLECSGILIGPKTVLTQGSCLVLPIDLPYRNTDQGPMENMADSADLYFSPGHLNSNQNLGLYPVESYTLPANFSIQGAYYGKDIAILTLKEGPELGFTPIISKNDFDQYEDGELLFLGHMLNPETFDNELWQDQLSFERSGLKWAINSDLMELKMPSFEGSLGVPVLFRIGSEYRVLGIQVERADVFKICLNCVRHTNSVVQFLHDPIYQNIQKNLK